ncbi:MAG: ATP-binding protein [Proteobacteria bacterium]|nr:MAG: ATP-binding protein [Pseudomonadota bacterium]
MATAYLICGSTGAGKTTHAQNLAHSENARIFSIDEWMQNLFWKDAPLNPDFNWAIERVQRCEKQIWLVAESLLRGGTNVILDLGFSKRTQRDEYRRLVSAAGATPRLIYLDIPAAIRIERVRERNDQKSGTYQFHVSDETFRWMEAYFEAPGEDELA